MAEFTSKWASWKAEKIPYTGGGVTDNTARMPSPIREKILKEAQGGTDNTARMPLSLATLSPDEREWWEERAAIIEYDGGLDRATAERLAWECLEAFRQPTTHNWGDTE